MAADTSPNLTGFAVGGLFAGIGGIELGFQQAGHHAAFFCERDPAASAVLATHLKGVPIFDDVRMLPARADELPHVDVLTGGFPCQDLSQAGRVAGIGGSKSGLVTYMFDVLDRLDARPKPPTWFVIENVINMLRLDRGHAMRFLTEALESRGYGWAYRVVDTIAFGLPQRRKRVLMVASKRLPMAPSQILFADEAKEPPLPKAPKSIGFYWTEGLRGIGWAPNAVPTLKGGSGLGIPSPPAIWLRNKRSGKDAFRLLSIEQAEKLQGFSTGWTDAELSDEPRRTLPGERWRMVGNAVSVPVARWLATRMRDFGSRDTLEGMDAAPMLPGTRWPDAASGHAGKVWFWNRSNFPLAEPPPALVDFVGEPETRLSARAALGFRERTLRGNLRLDPAFGRALDEYLEGLDVSLAEVRALSSERAEAYAKRRSERIAPENPDQLSLGV
jgi:DNA (cytosine-5)-methyltransferase 1